jgi:hypothetical protein
MVTFNIHLQIALFPYLGRNIRVKGRGNDNEISLDTPLNFLFVSKKDPADVMFE